MSDYRRVMPASITPTVPRSHWRKWQRCWEGLEPAEALSTRDREDLVWQLHERGWTDVEIAEHTRMTTYTAARIRERLGLCVRVAADAAAG